MLAEQFGMVYTDKDGKQKTAYEIIAGDWSSDVCSSDLRSNLTGYFSS